MCKEGPRPGWGGAQVGVRRDPEGDRAEFRQGSGRGKEDLGGGVGWHLQVSDDTVLHILLLLA